MLNALTQSESTEAHAKQRQRILPVQVKEAVCTPICERCIARATP
jgi:hypothetical protein